MASWKNKSLLRPLGDVKGAQRIEKMGAENDSLRGLRTVPGGFPNPIVFWAIFQAFDNVIQFPFGGKPAL